MQASSAATPSTARKTAVLTESPSRGTGAATITSSLMVSPTVRSDSAREDTAGTITV